MRSSLLFALALAVSAVAQGPAQRPAPTQGLRVFFADVEGGQATLFVSPASAGHAAESLLVDTGWENSKDRDADRIVSLVHRAGLEKIDTVLITHFHRDHAGGVPELLDRIAIGEFIDHGPNRDTKDPETEPRYQGYLAALASHHVVRRAVHPGDVLSFGQAAGVKVTIVSSDGDTLATPLAGAGAANMHCAPVDHPLDTSENERSLGFVLTYGKLRLLDLGDLVWNKELDLVCAPYGGHPHVDKLGPIDIYVASHHGFDRSGSPALVDEVAPKLAIFDNGSVKGAAASAWQIVHDSPNHPEIWQLHHADGNDAAHNASAAHTANLSGGTPTADGGPGSNDAGNSLLLTIAATGEYGVVIQPSTAK